MVSRLKILLSSLLWAGLAGCASVPADWGRADVGQMTAEHGSGGGDAREEARADAARQFWIIKHGIKASGMAAFGKTHDDKRICAMVAFLQKLPTLSPLQYQILTARTEGDVEHPHGASAEASQVDRDAATSSDEH